MKIKTLNFFTPHIQYTHNFLLLDKKRKINTLKNFHRKILLAKINQIAVYKMSIENYTVLK